MKTKYLLSTLAIGAAFVACTNEDLVVDEQMNVASNEVVGAKLLSKGLTLNFNELEDADSRATATGWEVGKDVAGLGWLVVGDPGDLQTRADLSQVESVLYNNHFFQYTEEGWNTKSNRLNYNTTSLEPILIEALLHVLSKRSLSGWKSTKANLVSCSTHVKNLCHVV